MHMQQQQLRSPVRTRYQYDTVLTMTGNCKTKRLCMFLYRALDPFAHVKPSQVGDTGGLPGVHIL